MPDEATYPDAGRISISAEVERRSSVTLAQIDEAFFALEEIAERFPGHDFEPLFDRLERETDRLEALERRRRRRVQRATARTAL